MKFNILSSLAVSALLVGCGGSDSPSNDEKVNVAQTNEKVEKKIDESVVLKNISYIQGIYDISGMIENAKDEVYLSINKDGLIATYDYMGDDLDNEENCYEKNGEIYNTTLNGLYVTNDKTNKLFTVGDSGYNWHYYDGQNISKVSISGISATTKLSINGTMIATSSLLTTTITLSEIEQSLCE